MDLSKVVVESFDVKIIRARLAEVGASYDKNDMSIVLLEKLLNHGVNVADKKKLLGLRTVQRIRSKVKGHSGGREAEQLALDALAQHETFAGHFKYVCEFVSDELKAIERLFS